MRMILATLFLMVAGAATARDNSVAAWGVGAERCADIYREPQSEAEVRPFVEGYLSAAYGLRGKRENSQAASGLTFEVEQRCKAKPNALMLDILKSAISSR